MENQQVEIDGSFGEGGGQVIRTSLSLAAMTGRAVEITNIRARRSKPGLQAQHLTAVRAAAALCDAKMSGDQAGSTHLRFEPQSAVKAGDYRFDIGTAGATPLVAQTVLLPLSHANGASTVTIIGGTHVPNAPPVDYLETVYVSALLRAGLDVAVSYSAAGFYPRGGGQLELQVRAPAHPAPLNLTDRGKMERLRAVVVTSNLPDHVSERGAAAVEKFMKAVGRRVVVERRNMPSPGTGAAVVLIAECENGIGAFTGIGERGRPIEKVAETPCEEFMAWWKTGAACDEHLADQLVLPLAFAAGENRWSTPSITDHLRTVLWVTQQFLPITYAFEETDAGNPVVVLCGAGLA